MFHTCAFDDVMTFECLKKKTMEQKMGTQPLSNIYSTLRVVTLDSILDRFFDLKIDRCYYLSAHRS